MVRLAVLILALAAFAGAASAAPRLERVVLVTRHGVRPPTQTNDALAKYSDKPWPAWPVAPGELTPHGGQTVRLMGDTLRTQYRRAGLLPARGCAGASQVTVFAHGRDQRTRESGAILAEALQPGCGVAAQTAPGAYDDAIFEFPKDEACRVDEAQGRASLAAAAARPEFAAPLTAAIAKLQAIFAPKACEGGAGTCFKPAPPVGLPVMGTSLVESLVLEYADGKPMADVGWGRASAADIAKVMVLHERAFALIRDNAYAADRRGATMARVVLAGLAATPPAHGPAFLPTVRVLALSGHDTNLVLMAAIFGLSWTLPGEPDGTAPASTLAFEVWSDHGHRFVRPVIYYETLSQLRSLTPALARRLPLTIKDCASGPLASCPLEEVTRRVEALIPRDCGAL
jgi:4-phytase/acid phosphatase